MPLSSAAERVGAAQVPGPKCTLGAVLRGLSDDDLAFFEQMVADGVPKAHIARVFREDGHHVRPETVRRHLAGECSCP